MTHTLFKRPFNLAEKLGLKKVLAELDPNSPDFKPFNPYGATDETR